MAPQMPGYAIVWADDFNGPSGSAVDQSKWDQVSRPQSQNSNNELENYTNSTDATHLSGDGGLYIIPKHDSGSNMWNSARLEGKSAFSCDNNHKMVFQAEIRVGFRNNPAQNKGMWPAFWTLGNDIKTGTSWPKCAEWDILETATTLGNKNQGTLHYQDANGNRNGSFNNQVTYSQGEYHTWALKVDRTSGDWQTESLVWYLDGQEFYRVNGSQIGTPEQWGEVAHKSFFPILNVAVGGGFPGNPDGNTLGGFESGM